MCDKINSRREICDKIDLKRWIFNKINFKKRMSNMINSEIKGFQKKVVRVLWFESKRLNTWNIDDNLKIVIRIWRAQCLPSQLQSEKNFMNLFENWLKYLLSVLKKFEKKKLNAWIIDDFTLKLRNL